MGEGPDAHEVELNAYEIGRYPVTVEEFRKFVTAGGPKPNEWDEQLVHPNRPVIDVSWDDAMAYCEWAKVRLATEAEWERAARGSEGRVYPWGDVEPDASRANYADAKVGAPTPVGLFPNGATPEGICDMAGNVWEWVADWHGEYRTEKQRNPMGPQTGERRVLRGGSCYFIAWYLRAAFHIRNEPEYRGVDIGFRCAREVSVP